MDRSSRSSIRILMFPWLAYGHISPFLELAKSLAKRNFISYVCSTEATLNSIKSTLSEKDSVSIKLVELQLPTSPDLPPRYHTTNALPPHLMGILKDHFYASRPEFSKILETIKPDLLMYDFLPPWAALEANSRGIPSVLFFIFGAASISYILHKWFRSESMYPFPAIEYRENESSMRNSVVYMETKDDEQLTDGVNRSSGIVLIKTFRGLEGKYIDYLSGLTGRKFVPVSALIDLSNDHLRASTNEEGSKNEIIEWLDKQEERSTIFASFGSEYFLSENEIQAIAVGLERSGFHFIWAVRFPTGDKKRNLQQEILPKGFVDRVGERGMVVEGWVPQREILAHKSVAAFLSHCGCCSMMEAIYFCLPIIAMPMHLDQPLTARMMEDVGFGKEVVRDNKDRQMEGEEVALVVKMVMADIDGLRSKVEELRENMLTSMEGEIDDVAEELMAVLQGRERSDP